MARFSPWHVGKPYQDKQGNWCCALSNMGEAQVSATVHGSTADVARATAAHLAECSRVTMEELEHAGEPA